MSTIVRMSLEEARKYRITEEEEQRLTEFEEDFTDPEIPPQTPEELKQFRLATKFKC